MRAFLALVVFAGLGYLFYLQKHSATDANAPASAKSVAAQPATAPNTQLAQPQQPAPQNWMKRSLDRATEVRDQARKQTRDSQDP